MSVSYGQPGERGLVLARRIPTWQGAGGVIIVLRGPKGSARRRPAFSSLGTERSFAIAVTLIEPSYRWV